MTEQDKNWTFTIKAEKEPPCEEGRTWCEGNDLYECVDGEKVLKKKDAKECKEKPPFGNIALIAGAVGLVYLLSKRGRR